MDKDDKKAPVKEAPKASPKMSEDDQYMVAHGWEKRNGKWVKDILDAKTGKVVGTKERI